MAISAAIPTAFKLDLMQAIHNFASGNHSFKLALYTSSAALGATTSAYSSTNEVANGNGYTTGGNTLDESSPTTSSGGATVWIDFADTDWTTASFTARGALLYNDTSTGDRAVQVLDFGSDKTVSSGTFTVVFPAADSSTAILRLA